MWALLDLVFLCQRGDGQHQGQRIAAQCCEAMVLIERRRDLIFGIDNQRKDTHTCWHGALPAEYPAMAPVVDSMAT